MADEVSLKEYMESKLQTLDTKINSQEELNRQHFQLNELAIKKAEDSMSLRLDGMNEFRNQIKDERGSLATKEACAACTKGLDERIKELETSKAKLEGKASQRDVNNATVIAVIGTIIAIVGLILKFVS